MAPEDRERAARTGEEGKVRDDGGEGICHDDDPLIAQITANRHRGVRATPCYDSYTARMSREHNDSNVLVLGGRVTGPELLFEIVRIWLRTSFRRGRHARRLGKIL